MPVVVKAMTRRVGDYGLHLWLQVGTSPSFCLWIVVLYGIQHYGDLQVSLLFLDMLATSAIPA